MAKPPVSVSSPSSIDIVDGNFTFAVTDWVRSHATGGVERVTFSYSELKSVLALARQGLGYRSADARLAAVSVDPANKSQQKFPEALERLDYAVERMDFRHNYVSVPAGPDADRADRISVTSLSPSLAYVLGMLTGQSKFASLKPEVVVVTGSFDLFYPLRHFVRRTGGRVALAFFRRFLDHRWAMNGLFDPDSPVGFVDLEEHSERLLGVNMASLLLNEPITGSRGGLDSLW